MLTFSMIAPRRLRPVRPIDTAGFFEPGGKIVKTGTMLNWVIATALLVSPAASFAETSPDIAGHWETTFGPLDFVVTDIKDASGAVVGKAATAPYKSEGGTVSGELKGSTLVGYWHEPESSLKCGAQRGGTWYWGRVEFVFNSAVNEYQGTWGYCDETPERGWSGRRG